MKRYAVILTITYRDAVRTRKGTMPDKDFSHVAGKLVKIADWQAELDAETQGAPSIINLRIREIKTKAKA